MTPKSESTEYVSDPRVDALGEEFLTEEEICAIDSLPESNETKNILTKPGIRIDIVCSSFRLVAIGKLSKRQVLAILLALTPLLHTYVDEIAKIIGSVQNLIH